MHARSEARTGMSNQSEHDRRVKDILDRVAKGHLSTEEATTLIAAIQPPTTSGTTEADEPAARPPVAEDVPTPTPGDQPSPSVWADAVDSPDVASADVAEPVGRHAADGVQDSPAAEGVQDSVVDEAPAETATDIETEAVEEVEEEHSNVPMPAGVQRATVRAINSRSGKLLENMDLAPVRSVSLDEIPATSFLHR